MLGIVTMRRWYCSGSESEDYNYLKDDGEPKTRKSGGAHPRKPEPQPKDESDSVGSEKEAD